MALRPTTLASFIVGGVGAVFVLTGGILRGAVDAARETARVEGIPVATPASWKDLAPGTTVLVEGRIARATPAAFRDFVACRRYRFAGRETTGTSKGSPRWTPIEKLAPPLSLETTGGAVALASGGYDLLSPCHRWEEEDVVARALNTRTERAEGFRAGGAVVAEGRVGEQGLDAALLFCGTRKAYVDAARASAELPGMLGALLLALGGLLLLLLLLLLVAGAVAWPGRARGP